MTSLKNEVTVISKRIRTKNDIEKINPKEIIKEALELSPKEDEEGEIEKRKISEVLNEIKEKTIKEYLNSVSNKKIMEIKDELNTRMEIYNKNMFAIIMKSKVELKETKKENTFLKSKIRNLTNENYLFKNYNNELFSQIKEYEKTLNELENNYSTLNSQKNLFEEIIKNYPGETPKDIVDQLNIAKKGSLMMLESYADMTKEIEEIKKNRKDLEESFKKKINHITNENDKLFNEKKDDKEKYIKKIYELKNKIEFNENKIKENDFLRNTLYYIYNIFFDKLNLVRDIVIDEKYKGLNKRDFNPNVLYDSELISYIELMLERMHTDSYDKMFRECIGYLNMIIRNYLPDKEKLRFKPVEIFREITNFIDLKMKLIEEYQNVIKHNKININNLQMQNNKLNEKYKNLSKEYESYKILVEKNLEKNSKDYIREKSEKNKKNKKTNQFLSGFNSVKRNKNKDEFNSIDIMNKKGMLSMDYKLNYAETKNEKNKIKKKLSLKLQNVFSPDKKQRIMSAFKGNSIYNRYYHNIKNKSEKKMRNKSKIYSFDENIKNKIEKNINEDKLLKENGNQENINNLNRITGLIDETNRLFLYMPRMTSFQKKFHTFESEEKIIFDNPEINSNLGFKTNYIKVYEGKITKKIDKLISSTKMN